MSYPQFLKYLIPSVLTMIFLSFYTTIDGFFVSRYAGSDALAGINIVIPITCVIFGTSVMLATGSGAIIGERMGQKREQEANEIFTFMTIVLLVLSVAFTAVGILFLKPICIFLGSSERLMEQCGAIRICHIFRIGSDVIQAIFRISCEDGWEIVHRNDHVSDRSGF